MTVGGVTNIIMDKVCLYDNRTMEDIWRGMIGNIPAQYMGLEIQVIGAKRKGIVDIGVSLPMSGNVKKENKAPKR